MRITRRTVLVSAMASAAAPAVMRLARADAPAITLKLHHFLSSVSSGHDKFLVPWARQIEAESGGRLRIDIFPSMQLGGAPAQLFDQARDGAADIVWTAPSLTPGRFPKIEMFELPFVLSRRALVGSKALADFAPVYLKDEFDEIHPLSFSCADRGVIHANAPVRTIEDIKGLKLHVQTRLAGEAMRMLGAEPVPMPIGQLPMAITAHVVDGCVDPWHMVPPLRLNDLLKAHTEFSDLSLSSTTFVLAMNKASYDRLPRDLKAALDRNSGQVAAAMAGAMWDVQAAAVATDVGQRGDVIVTLLPETVAHWRKATEPVAVSWLKDMKERKVDGAKLLAGAHALLVKYANEPEPQPQPTQTRAPAEQQIAPQPAAHPDAKADVTTMPKTDTPPAQPPGSAAKIAPQAAPAPHIATRTSAPATAPPVATPTPAAPLAPATAATAPIVKPVPMPALPVIAAPPAPTLAPTVPTPVPATVSPPRTLNIPF